MRLPGPVVAAHEPETANAQSRETFAHLATELRVLRRLCAPPAPERDSPWSDSCRLERPPRKLQRQREDLERARDSVERSSGGAGGYAASLVWNMTSPSAARRLCSRAQRVRDESQ